MIVRANRLGRLSSSEERIESYRKFGGYDISKVVCRIIENYEELIKKHELTVLLDELQGTADYNLKVKKLNVLLTEDAGARIFEIISYTIKESL